MVNFAAKSGVGSFLHELTVLLTFSWW